uniref:Nucleoporin Nup54 alpha-helical domain-containing protein n=1 Tax=Lynx canadensis TaxID=61383 RepID=A0A667G526_LYNCA
MKINQLDFFRLIPVPMVGFKELLRRLKVQDQMTKQHQTRLDIISEDISELQKNQTTTMAKIAQYKRKLMDLSHRTLQVLIKQEIQRKSGYAIQADEEQLRVQLDTIQCELNAPTQFKVGIYRTIVLEFVSLQKEELCILAFIKYFVLFNQNFFFKVDS